MWSSRRASDLLTADRVDPSARAARVRLPDSKTRAKTIMSSRRPARSVRISRPPALFPRAQQCGAPRTACRRQSAEATWGETNERGAQDDEEPVGRSDIELHALRRGDALRRTAPPGRPPADDRRHGGPGRRDHRLAAGPQLHPLAVAAPT